MSYHCNHGDVLHRDHPQFLNVSFPVAFNFNFIQKQLKRMIDMRREELGIKKDKKPSSAKYQITTNKIGVQKLKQYLDVWDYRQSNPDKKRLEIADKFKIALIGEYDPDTRKRTVSRYTAFANKFIENVGKSDFPKK